ncbi:DUF6099 family protein [Streptomyces sp. H27-D2]|uniref:DUF6099 family protein n=1 Tax=Streptomyces sp. H27-D2 TaxID=3046304 RepID=UPI002DB853FD|nr:DUF6099 family protein [Streptomyces sp. H27-D2]MEC4016599.1 DUF6099 family protein [Streptomyces sp. H27-D2]
MDAVRLIRATGSALARARSEQDIVAEAWQAQALAGAVGSHLAVNGPPELRTEAYGLSESGTRACGALHHPAPRVGGVRAAQLSAVSDLRAALLGLGGLLGEVGMLLVGVACAAEEEAMYWHFIEAIDAADESRDRVTGMLRQLAMRERGGAA